jgi:UDP-3-O-[3-hydroxymyristoyl] N-acetylglucosamine deacetylase / 3-hydroxyacyl-[acyl-carrier-protein] dehydratase
MELQTQQTTLAKPVSFTGIGLHTGNKSTITFNPAPINTGIKFVRIDLSDKPEIQALVSNVKDISRGTTIGVGDVRIHTVEHILAAITGLQLDNVIIEVDSNEPPVGDGSSLPFLKVLKEAGVNIQGEPREFFELTETITVNHNDMYVVIMPDKEFRVSFTVAYNHPLLGCQYESLVVTPEVFEREIASSRTFCFEDEVETLKQQGLIKGGSLENAVVIGKDKILNENLRYQDEFVRHKMLDIIGDLTLLGKPLKAHVMAIKSGHALNIKAAQKLNQMQTRTKRTGMKVKRNLVVGKQLDINQIKEIIPHRYPFLLVDKIIDIEEDKRAVGIKNVSINEPFFNGHFPGHPIMPGVLIVEALAQVAGVLMLGKEENLGKIAYFMSIDKVKLRKPVLPGDQLVLEVEMLKIKTKTGLVAGKAYVNDQLVTQCEFKFAIIEG